MRLIRWICIYIFKKPDACWPVDWIERKRNLNQNEFQTNTENGKLVTNRWEQIQFPVTVHLRNNIKLFVFDQHFKYSVKYKYMYNLQISCRIFEYSGNWVRWYMYDALTPQIEGERNFPFAMYLTIECYYYYHNFNVFLQLKLNQSILVKNLVSVICDNTKAFYCLLW